MMNLTLPVSRRFLTAAFIGLSGAAVLAAMLELVADNLPYDAAFGGAAIAGFLLADLFGKEGWHGFGFAFTGAIFATLAGASIAGLIVGIRVDDLSLVYMAVTAVVIFVFLSPLVTAVWFLTLGSSHFLLRWLYRRNAPDASP